MLRILNQIIKANVVDLIENFEFHDAPVNTIKYEANLQKVIFNIDYFIDKNGIHQDVLIHNINVVFCQCNVLEFCGNTSLINNSSDKINGSILKSEIYNDPNYKKQGIKLFIQIDDYIRKTIIPENIFVFHI